MTFALFLAAMFAISVCSEDVPTSAPTTSPADVDGGWSKWSPWTPCHVTCGGDGTQTRQRTCNNPPPRGDGNKCPDDTRQSRACADKPCPPACTKALDIGILLDGSGHVGQDSFNKSLGFLSSLVTHLQVSSGGSHIGLIAYGTDAKLVFKMADQKYQEFGALKEKIGSITYPGGDGETRTDKALQLASEQLFTYRGGDRWRQPNMLLVFTNSKTDRERSGVYPELLRSLQVRGVRTLAIGVGDGDGLAYELLQLAMGVSRHVVQVSSYEELKKRLSSVVRTICQASRPPAPTPECYRIDALGLASGNVHIAAVTASSELDRNHGPELARLNMAPLNGRAGAWCAKHRDPEQWLQVDFTKVVKVVRVATQGRYDKTEFVKSYWLSYSQDGGYFIPYMVNGKVQILVGNADRDTIVPHSLSRPIYARYVRINPVTWSGSVCMRAEFYGCRTGFVPPPRMPCLKDLGMQRGRILDSHITAMSELSSVTRPANARLYWHPHGGRSGGWSAASDDKHPWLQVNLGPETKIRGLAVQGRQDKPEWVTGYTLAYSEEGVFWLDYQQHGKTAIFTGNTDQHGVVTQLLDPPIIARYVRINPQSTHGHASMRLELYGCTSGFSVPQSTCTRGLGMTTGGIPNAHVTATSHLDTRSQPFFGRLNMPVRAWTAKTSELGQWLQLDIGRVAKVTRIATQGNHGADEWVTSYRLAYSLDNGHYQSYSAGKILAANKDRNSIVGHILPSAILARYIRVLPQAWHSRISLRVEVYGCTSGFTRPSPPRCMKSLGLEHGTLRDDQLTASSQLDSNAGPDRARLQLQPEGGKAGGWVAKQNDLHQWLQVDFQQTVRVSRVSTQGQQGVANWVVSYELRSSQDGYLYETYKQKNKAKTFQGNNDQHSVASHVITPPIVARYIRLVPRTWHGRIALRLDLYGCTSGFPRPPTPNCAKPLGLEGHRIPDRALSASSSMDVKHGPQRARLNSAGSGILAGSWTARTNDKSQWIQVDLGAYKQVTRVATQGAQDQDEWVTQYRIQHSGDGKVWKTYREGESLGKEFAGNSDRNTIVVNTLDPPINGVRYIRVLPSAWHGGISMRLEMFGCQGVGPTQGPTHAPCNAALDVGILMDRSGNLGYYQFRKSRDFVTSLVTRLNIAPSGTRIAILAYSYHPQRIVDFRYAHAQNPSKMNQMVSRIPFTSGPSRTDLALKYASEQLFTVWGGDRPDSKNVLIVLTDGSSHDNTMPYDVVLRPLLAKGVKVIAVGVGQHVNHKELLKIANHEYNSVISINNIDSLLTLMNGVAHGACPVPTQPPSCTAGWLHYKSNCYFFEHQHHSFGKWHDAHVNCNTLGGHLVDIHSNDEWEWVRSHLKPGPDVGGVPKQYLIGMRDHEMEHHWKWEDGSYVSFFRWTTGSPHGGRNQNCGAMYAGNGLFNDVSCQQQIGYFVCKRGMD